MNSAGSGVRYLLWLPRLSKLRAHQPLFGPMETKVCAAAPESTYNARAERLGSMAGTAAISLDLPRYAHFAAIPCSYWAYSFHSFAFSAGSVSCSAAFRSRRATMSLSLPANTFCAVAPLPPPPLVVGGTLDL